ncbi:hypothetical protein K2173_012207 [Erythroxylum novogranatense]|uniref:Cytochrome P450 n=1 Tax=Erythroxylum novogranatense TaxID=1862640 RepID=A0AAV8T7H1_9ROSI|nr:hypothetical protein K2173_012207 [Erythroxylum novogranatense]
METIHLILISVALSLLVKTISTLIFHSNKPPLRLPPGPPAFPVIGNFLWLRKSFSDIEPIIRSLHAKFGPMIALHIGSLPAIFVADRCLAYQALIHNGAVFADRLKAGPIARILSANQHTINSAHYGPTWRILRRNLTSQILHPSRVKAYSHARNWVLQTLENRLESVSKSGNHVKVVEEFQYAMFCLLVFMCFGDKLDQNQVKEIERVERALLLNSGKLNALNFWPSVTKILLRKRWAEFLQLRKDQEDVLIPLIRARKKIYEERQSKAKEDFDNEKDKLVLCYVDTLLDLQLPDEKTKLTEDEIVSLCDEFLNAGTDTTSTALEWILANLVKYPHIQGKLFTEIEGVMESEEEEEEVKEEVLQKTPYLKAVILEGLRRHPPGHFVVPHAVTEDIELGGHVVPKNGTINFMVADMGWDPEVWEDPMSFKPERFMSGGEGEAVDITGSKEIKMMPFGVGRRICPGYVLAMLHLEYFVANLIWKFEWKAVDGDEVDLSEKQQFTTVMKNPLKANLIPRIKN